MFAFSTSPDGIRRRGQSSGLDFEDGMIMSAPANGMARDKTMQDKTHLVDDITGHRRMRRNRKADWTCLLYTSDAADE